MPPEGMRRSSRIPRRKIGNSCWWASDMEGKNVFLRQTKTVVLSRHGAGIVSQLRTFPQSKKLILRRLDYRQGS